MKHIFIKHECHIYKMLGYIPINSGNSPVIAILKICKPRLSIFSYDKNVLYQNLSL